MNWEQLFNVLEIISENISQQNIKMEQYSIKNNIECTNWRNFHNKWIDIFITIFPTIKSNNLNKIIQIAHKNINMNQYVPKSTIDLFSNIPLVKDILWDGYYDFAPSNSMIVGGEKKWFSNGWHKYRWTQFENALENKLKLDMTSISNSDFF